MKTFFCSQDYLMQVQQMLDRISDWESYLERTKTEVPWSLIEQHLRTGRPLGSTEFTQTLESRLGRRITPRKPGRRAKVVK